MQTKFDGNASSDGFGLYMALITGLFGVGGVALAKVGAIALLGGLPVFLVLVGLMAMKLSKWDVMTTAPAMPSDMAKDAAARTTFAVAAQTEEKPVKATAPWAPSKSNASSLPATVDKPKVTVETNTSVA